MENLDPIDPVDITPSEITWGCAVDFFGEFSCVLANIFGNTPLNTSLIQIYGGGAGPDLDGSNPFGTGLVILTAPTPEPVTGGLMLFGLGFMLAMRKRLGLGLHRAS
jgi:hypothetical protein